VHEIELPESVEELLNKVREYMPEVDTSLILDAYFFAEKKHHGQKRRSGEPYITHPLAVAHLLADLQMGPKTLIAGLLHDTLEDTSTTREEIAQRFGETVAMLVEGVSKLKWPDEVFENSSEVAKQRAEVSKIAENLRKMLVAVAEDLRVMVIKLADRLHNMQTLDSMSESKRTRIATETLQIYSPLAHRLGIWQVKSQLDDLAFKYLHPKEYEELSAQVARTKERQEEVYQLVATLKERIMQQGIHAEVFGRPKHLWSIYQKMLTQEIDLDQIYDLIAMRVITDTENECYQVLGIVHDLWRPIPALFYDYIAMPKPNGYRSLHTKVIVPSGRPLEVQIRTWDMHQTAEYGVAAHWRYKEGDEKPTENTPRMKQLQEQLSDLASLRGSTEFLNEVMRDIAADQVFVFTPKGDVIDLPMGSTPVDFAYRIHTELGHRCVRAKVNGKVVQLTHVLHNGDIVEVETKSQSRPSRDWLGFVRSSGARSKIRAYFRKMRHDEFVTRGRDMVEKEAERSGFTRTMLNERLPDIAKMMSLNTADDLLAFVGEGLASVQGVIQKLKGLQSVPVSEKPVETIVTHAPAAQPVRIAGLDDVLHRRARCCDPVPGDDVVGYISRGRGIVIHRAVCGNIKNYLDEEPDRVVPVDWSIDSHGAYTVPIRLETVDRVGLLGDITTMMGDSKVNIVDVRVKGLPDRTVLIEMRVQVQNAQQLQVIFQKIRTLNDVIDVYRVEPKQKHVK
jgi:guanosine-3',5'-bis(diphosphate) 3'-pyrophosphohydrolase